MLIRSCLASSRHQRDIQLTVCLIANAAGELTKSCTELIPATERERIIRMQRQMYESPNENVYRIVDRGELSNARTEPWKSRVNID